MLKKATHYLLLAAVLVGLPMGCAHLARYDEMLADVAAFPPRCEEWLDDPTRLWRVKCPFNWWVFALFALITGRWSCRLSCECGAAGVYVLLERLRLFRFPSGVGCRWW